LRAGRIPARTTEAGIETMDALSYAYSPQLIDELRQEHRALTKRYHDIEKMVLESRLQGIPHGLSAFKSKFNVHALRENLHCYVYLERQLARRPAELAAMTQLRDAMDAIGHQVLDFVEKYRSAGVSRTNAQEFLKGLRDIGKLLQERIQRVESGLYPLYKP
jgi:regulator of sigma D